MEKRQKFEMPEAILIAFDDQDVIATSGAGQDCDPDDQWGLCS